MRAVVGLGVLLMGATAAQAEQPLNAPMTPRLESGMRVAQRACQPLDACGKTCKERYNACLAVRSAEYCRPAQERCIQACQRNAC